MKIIADQQIPYLSNFFGSLGELIILPDKKITSSTIKEADVLLVRSVTTIDSPLISHSSIRFIGSATAGIDHIDTNALNKANIAWAYAPGCNAKAVADYVLLSIAQLIIAGILQKTKVRAGVIGVGNVGQQVADTLIKLGFDVILNDPPRNDNETDFVSTSLDAFYDLDLICLHTPLTTTGKYPTTHLINQDFLKQLNPRCILLNAGRGACVDSNALKQFSLTTVLDVWESEPNIDIALAESSFIATPHIAGYSQPAKYRATKQLFEAFSQHFEMDHYVNPSEDPSEYHKINLLNSDWPTAAIKFADLKQLTSEFQSALKSDPNNAAEIFKQFRRAYVFRPELNFN